MSTLHSILSARFAVSARASARRSAVSAIWPGGTQHLTDDILIGGESLAAAAHDAATPLVRIGEADGASTEIAQRFVTVLATRIEHVDRLGALQRPYVWIDAALHACDPVIEAARIIGRPTSEHRRMLHLRSELDPGAHFEIELPADVRAGDLLVVPCRGTVARNQVAGRRPPRLPGATEEPDENDAGFGICGK